jgi:membrane-bound ClpP family serine protease
MKKLDKSIVGLAALIIILFMAAWIFDSYRGHLVSVAGFLTFLTIVHLADYLFSKSPSVGTICVALTDLSPEGKIEYAEEPTDARAAKGYMIKSGQECEIIDLKKGIFAKGIYVVRPLDEKDQR